MKILSWNVNGLRSISKKGFDDWLKKENADIVCLQEIRAQKEQLTSELLKPQGYDSFINSAQKKGYSGVLVYSREKPISVKRKLGISRFDNEGRILELKYKTFTLINLYLPHGGRKKENLKYKLSVYEKLLRKLERNNKRKLIVIGDFNIAHKEIDLERPKQNGNNIMFTPAERKQIDSLINLKFIDTFREFHKKGGNYTWWPYMRNARQRNLGWRIDYCFISDSFSKSLTGAFILSKVEGSDHCPIGIIIN